jgi:hypothetical protein
MQDIGGGGGGEGDGQDTGQRATSQPTLHTHPSPSHLFSPKESTTYKKVAFSRPLEEVFICNYREGKNARMRGEYEATDGRVGNTPLPTCWGGGGGARRHGF